ncbi:Protein of unknown function [Cotesia congregata]|uniref:Uncharacterized protein n=1 Tax=Cotesia congregata TaxID=51543 RepID=A0A8J2GZD5_COTCN|nr:Protein of unknown function [Cotesia congregata]
MTICVMNILVNQTRCELNIKNLSKVLLIFQVRMPPKCRVPIDDAINVLIKYISYFASDQLPEWSSDVWDKMSNEPEFKDKWNVPCIRTNIKENSYSTRYSNESKGTM